jgi:hypothetical protein
LWLDVIDGFFFDVKKSTIVCMNVSLMGVKKRLKLNGVDMTFNIGLLKKKNKLIQLQKCKANQK